MSVVIASLLTFVQLPRQNCKAQDDIADIYLEDAKRKKRKGRRGSDCRTGRLMSDEERSDAIYSFDTVLNGKHTADVYKELCCPTAACFTSFALHPCVLFGCLAC